MQAKWQGSLEAGITMLISDKIDFKWEKHNEIGMDII